MDFGSIMLDFLNFSGIFLKLHCFAPVAQSVEQLPFKERVAGSIPAGRTKFGYKFCGLGETVWETV